MNLALFYYSVNKTRSEDFEDFPTRKIVLKMINDCIKCIVE